MTFTELIDTAIKATVLGGKNTIEIYKDPNVDFSIEKKADNSPLTIADKSSHDIIVSHLKKTYLPILSEEGKSVPYNKRKKWDLFWLVDPLDGTKEFIKKNGEFTVNIALIENKVPIAGVIYVPVTKTLYVGILNGGAWKMENVQIECDLTSVRSFGVKLPLKSDSNTYKVVGSRSHMSKETEDYIEKLKKQHRKVEMVSKGSSLKICMIAEGTANEYPRFGPTMEWDTAAGHAIANAAGKKILLTDHSRELQYNKENLLNPYFIVR